MTRFITVKMLLAAVAAVVFGASSAGAQNVIKVNRVQLPDSGSGYSASDDLSGIGFVYVIGNTVQTSFDSPEKRFGNGVQFHVYHRPGECRPGRNVHYVLLRKVPLALSVGALDIHAIVNHAVNATNTITEETYRAAVSKPISGMRGPPPRSPIAFPFVFAPTNSKE